MKILICPKINLGSFAEFRTFLQFEEYIASIRKEDFYSYFKKNYIIKIKRK